MTQSLRIATVNVNGIRAAFRKGMAEWLEEVQADIIALQEVRAERAQLCELVGDDWHVLHDPSLQKGRAGVAILSRKKAVATRVGLEEKDAASEGRWLEADYRFGNETITVVSVYMHSGEVGTERQESKWAMLAAMMHRLQELRESHRLVAVVGDMNVGHRELDIKNWRNNRKNSGFLPRERAFFDQIFAPAGTTVNCVDETEGIGLGWVDAGRVFCGEVDGPYTWWSNRGQAFVNNTGWRIDYQILTPELNDLLVSYRVDRYSSYEARWSDHAPVIADYRL